MSTWHDEEIACPFCGVTQVVKVATGLHISRLPHIREKVIRGELHRFACSSCAREIEVRQRVIYTDFDRGHWIEVWPAQDIAQWRELAPACQARYQQAVERGAPILRERVRDFRVRLVFGYDELREKLVLWDAGFDDVAVEILKLLAVRRDPSIFGIDDRLVVRAVVDGTLEIDRTRGGAPAGTTTLTTSTGELESLRAELEPALDHAFSDPFVSINRLIGRPSVTAS